MQPEVQVARNHRQPPELPFTPAPPEPEHLGESHSQTQADRAYRGEKVVDIGHPVTISNREKALEFSTQFTKRWQKEVPSAVKCMQNSLDSCLTFFDFPEEEWISLRTTNVIERLNKEFKRRTKPMEIVAGENACYTLLAFISIKMEIHWRSNPVGKVRYNLPSLRNLIEGNFTQSP